jgi:DNA gyrase/topoisomerase IV subunit A
LDELFQDADMQPADIDAVIRTGGSSQIPLFVAMLEQRFGADKVSDIDAFASVTSGLGVIAHRLETGDIQLPYYDVDTYTGHIDLHPDVTTRVPAIDLDTLKRIIDTQETSHPDSASATTFITRDNQQYLYATTYNDFEAIPLNSVELDETPFAYSLSAKSKIILLTSDYVSYIKSPLDIADLLKNDLHIELMEGFRKDAFSTERVQNIIQWDTLENADFLILTSTLGYTKKYIGERILPKLSLPTPYRFAKMRGYPAFFVGAKAEQDYLIVTHAGRASRTRVSDVSLRESRPITVPLKGKMIGAMSANADDEILIATRSGYAKRVSVGSIPTLTEMNTNGTKITQRGNPIYAKLFDPLKPLFALTNQRIVEIEPSYIPILDAHKTDHKLFNMKKSEALITLFDL